VSLTSVGAIDRILSERLVVLLRAVEDTDRLVAELADAGIGVVEITMDSPGAERAIASARQRGDVSVIAGTVRTPDQVEQAADAGAEACVAPVYTPEVVARSLELGLPVIPAAFTPSEIETAYRAGAALVKLFPAEALGPSYVRHVLAPLADIPILASGGIDAENAPAYLAAGARAVALGSSLTKAPDTRAAARSALAAVRAAS
jgi:2-dehydro-3-deoxyphosphogluconate aldolase/(4S)-4-hydroxy-2-oxoglutarate aldolase